MPLISQEKCPDHLLLDVLIQVVSLTRITCFFELKV
jgi:hypothetical protein